MSNRKKNPADIKRRPYKLCLSDDQVVSMRRMYNGEGVSGGRTMPLSEIAEFFGVGKETAARAIFGKGQYAHIPGAASRSNKKSLSPRFRNFTTEQVIKIRADYRDKKALTPQLALEYGCSVSNIQFIISGDSYGDIPGAMKMHSKRKLTYEQVVDLRQKYASRKFPTKLLCKEFGITDSALRQIARGYIYKDIPYAVPEHIYPERGPRFNPRQIFNEEQVIYLRALFRQTRRSFSDLARQFGGSDTAMTYLVRGRTFAHLPGIVPSSIRAKHGPKPGFTSKLRGKQIFKWTEKRKNRRMSKDMAFLASPSRWQGNLLFLETQPWIKGKKLGGTISSEDRLIVKVRKNRFYTGEIKKYDSVIDLVNEWALKSNIDANREIK